MRAFCPIAEFAVGVVAPAVSDMCRGHAARVVRAGVDLRKADRARDSRGRIGPSLAPAVDVLRERHGTGMKIARADPCDTQAPRDQRRCIAMVCGGAVPQLALDVSTPAIGDVPAGDATGVQPDADLTEPEPTGDQRRREARRGGAVPEHAEIIATPAIPEAVGRHAAAVILTRAHLNEFETATDRRRDVAVGRRSVAQLAGLIASPAVAEAIRGDRARVFESRAHLEESDTVGDEGRRQRLVVRPVPQLSVDVIAPTPGMIRDIHAAAMEPARTDGAQGQRNAEWRDR